jgi:hypothetical protein
MGEHSQMADSGAGPAGSARANTSADESVWLSSMMTWPCRLGAVLGTGEVIALVLYVFPHNRDLATFFAVSTALWIWAFWPYFLLQHVSLNGSALTVGRRRTVDLKEIADVRGVGLLRQVVLIELEGARHPRRILFLPPLRVSGFSSAKSVIWRLRGLAAQARLNQKNFDLAP